MRTAKWIVPSQQQHAVTQPGQAAAVRLEQWREQAAGLAVITQVITPAATAAPTPGGVGPVTVACLMRNLVEAVKGE